MYGRFSTQQFTLVGHMAEVFIFEAFEQNSAASNATNIDRLRIRVGAGSKEDSIADLI